MKRAILFLTALSVLSLYSAQASATYYKWVDEKGKVWITDYPNPKYANKKAAAARQPDRAAKQDLPIPVTDSGYHVCTPGLSRIFKGSDLP